MKHFSEKMSVQTSGRASFLKILVVFSAVLTVAVCAIRFYVYGYRYLTGNYLAIELKTSVPGYGQVFFDTGLNFNEGQSYLFEIKPSSDFETYRIPLPASTIKSVRFDPLSNRGDFEIKSLTVMVRGKKVIRKGDELARHIVPQRQIAIAGTKPFFKGISTGEDPIFYVNGLVIPDYLDGPTHPVLFITVFAIVMTLLSIMLYWLFMFFIRLCRPYVPEEGMLSKTGKSLSLVVRPLLTPLCEISAPVVALRRLGDIQWLRYGGWFLLLVLWGRTVWFIYLNSGLFGWIGTDFAHYYAQSTVLWSGEPGAIYRPEVFDVVFQRLLDLYSPDHPEIRPTHVPYLPLFAWLFTPFTLPSPPIGFALWEGLNLLAVIHLAWRINQWFPRMKRTESAFLLLFSFPVVYSLIVGQPQLLLACAVAECYGALRGGRDFGAGLWLALLLFKPQYGLLIGLLLIWKRRWAAIAGVIVGGIFVVGGSALVAGVATLTDYPKALSQMAGFHSWDVGHMINWRSLVLMLCPIFSDFIGEQEGMMITQSLAFVTVFFTALAWRGAWLPGDSGFPVRFTLLLIATLIANHHSFNYGAVILAIPLAAALAEGGHDLLTGLSVIAGVVLPTLSFTLFRFGDVVWASRALTFSLLALYGGLMLWLWRYNQRMPDARSYV